MHRDAKGPWFRVLHHEIGEFVGGEVFLLRYGSFLEGGVVWLFLEVGFGHGNLR